MKKQVSKEKRWNFKK